MKPTLIIYHANCVDGFTAAWVAWRRYRDEAEYFPASYNSAGDVELPEVRGRDVVFVDFSTKREQLLRIKAEAKSLLVLDHHKTAEVELAGLDFCVFDMERSGAGLAQDYLLVARADLALSGGNAWLVDYVEDRDLWRFKMPDSKAVNAYIATKPFDFAAWEELFLCTTPMGAARAGRAIMEYIEQQVARAVKGARRINILGYDDIPVVNTTANISEVVGRPALARRRRRRRERAGKGPRRGRAQERCRLHLAAAAGRNRLRADMSTQRVKNVSPLDCARCMALRGLEHAERILNRDRKPEHARDAYPEATGAMRAQLELIRDGASGLCPACQKAIRSR